MIGLRPGRIHPAAIWLNGEFRSGLDAVISESGHLMETLPQTERAEPFLVSPAFINAHSHSEYRSLDGRIGAIDYPSFISAILEAKAELTPEQIKSGREQSGIEWAKNGIGWVFDHQDRTEGNMSLHLGGVNSLVFQELIDFDIKQAEARRKFVESAVKSLRVEGIGCWPTPHAPHTVAWDSLVKLGFSGDPLSIHTAESVEEIEFWQEGKGWIAEWRPRTDGAPVGVTPLGALEVAGALRPQTLLIHCCEVNESDSERIATFGAHVVHCPRSNRTLGCKTAPVRRFLESGIPVLLGTDSNSSGGDSSIIAEMGAALEESDKIEEPLTFDQVWGMAAEAPYRYLELVGYDQSNREMIGLRAESVEELERRVREGDVFVSRFE